MCSVHDEEGLDCFYFDQALPNISEILRKFTSFPAYHVSGLLAKALGVKRVGIFFEGYEIDCTHIRLVQAPNELEEGGDCWKVLPTIPWLHNDQAGPELKFDPKPGDCAASLVSDFEKLVSWYSL